jgi:hypothetical protein
LATSRGWVDVTQNGSVTVAGTTAGGVPYTTNGLPMSDNFDLAVYIKGDRKPTAVYDAYLEIDYEPLAVVPDEPVVISSSSDSGGSTLFALGVPGLLGMLGSLLLFRQRGRKNHQ